MPQCYSGAPSLNEAAVIGLTEGETTPKVDAAMVQGGIIYGTVTDSSTGKGIPDVTVTVLGASPRICVATGEPTCTAGGVAGTTGAYGTRVLASGLYSLQFSGNPAYKEKTVSTSAPVASLTTLDVSLEPAGTGGGGCGGSGGSGRRIGRIGRLGRIREARADPAPGRAATRASLGARPYASRVEARPSRSSVSAKPPARWKWFSRVRPPATRRLPPSTEPSWSGRRARRFRQVSGNTYR